MIWFTAGIKFHFAIFSSPSPFFSPTLTPESHISLTTAKNKLWRAFFRSLVDCSRTIKFSHKSERERKKKKTKIISKSGPLCCQNDWKSSSRLILFRQYIWKPLLQGFHTPPSNCKTWLSNPHGQHLWLWSIPGFASAGL